MPGQNFEVAAWLRDLGMERYTQAFLDAEVTPEVLRALTEADLRELGLPLGPRKIVLHAIRRLASPSATRPVAEAAAEDARPGATPSPRPERRLITVMFIDLVGSTALSIRLDPEDFRELIGAYQVRVTAAVERAGGFVAKYMGDGVLAYFGYPHAHEDDPERAIRAALELTASPRVSKGRPGLQSRSAPALRRGWRWWATCSAAARPRSGRSWARRRTWPRGCKPLQTRTASSSPKPRAGWLEACSIAATSGPFRPRASPRRSGRIASLDRQRSRAVSRRCTRARHPWSVARRRCACCCGAGNRRAKARVRFSLLSGEAGVGKSRLLAAVQEKLHGESPSLLRYFCSPHGRDSPFHPVIAQLERAAGFSHGDAPGGPARQTRSALGTDLADSQRSGASCGDAVPAAGQPLRITSAFPASQARADLRGSVARDRAPLWP